jgi:hypothetical protein
MCARLGKGGFVDDPDLRLTAMIDDLVGQAPLHVPDLPRTWPRNWRKA